MAIDTKIVYIVYGVIFLMELLGKEGTNNFDVVRVFLFYVGIV